MTAATAPGAYAAALRALADRGRFGIRLGLGRIRALLHELDDPQLAVRGALVAGTNGKGSVIALASAALRAAGHRVGETPKPHLVTYRERIVVDGEPIDEATFTTLIGEVLAAADRVPRRLGPPTEFELLTAAIFRHFAAARLDVALVEVGLGGRLDATHAWDGGVAALTNVALDHMDRLGDTIGAIAREKAAIVERGDLAVTGADGEALAILRRRCARLGVPLRVAPPAPLLGWDRDGIEVELPRLGRTRVGLRGRHQAANVAVADALLDALDAAGIVGCPPEARRAGYAAAVWPGRLELLEVDRGDRRVEVLLDGAHNPAGAAALARALDDLRPHLTGGVGSPITLVWASMGDKDVAGTLDALLAADALDRVRVLATSVGGDRALVPDVLAGAWRDAAARAGRALEVAPVPDVDAALDRALAAGTGPVVVAGSLYLVGAARARLTGAVGDPV